MVGVCCGCIAKPASVQPRKTYNTLVGQLFAGEPIRTDEAIDSSMRRKIQKLQEYVQVNPAKIPKVSRRLMRKIKATLLKPGDNLGYVKVAVHTYVYLLARSTDEVSSYSPSFFAREVVSGPDAVVPLLLKDMHLEMRTLGAELLAVFIRVQSQVDSKLDAIQAHVPQVCRAAQAALSADRKEQKLQETAERRRQGDKLAVPNPLDLVARRDPAHVAALEVACLRCLTELVALCWRNKVLPKHLTAIQAVMLDNLRVRDRGLSRASEALQPPDTPTTPAAASAGGVVSAAAAAAAESSASSPAGSTAATAIPSVVDTACYQALGIHGAVPSGSNSKQLAGQLLSLMGSFTRDIATVHTILDSFYEYLDERHRWQERGIIRELLTMLNASGSQHQFPMYASLLRHASSRRLALQDCAVVLSLAAEKGAALDECYSLAALALALHEVPRAWAQQAGRAPRTMPIQAFLDLLRVGPAREAGAQPAADGGAAGLPASAAGNGPSNATAADATLAHGNGPAAALATYPSVSPAAATPAGVAVVSSGGDKGDMAVFKQQLAHLKEALLAAVRLLAGRIGTAAELCEAVTGALAAAGAELGLTGPGGSAGAASVLFSGLVGGQSVGSGGGAAAAAAGGGAGVQAGPDQEADASEAAAAAMMLQCAAAATAAFVAQCGGSSRGTALQQAGAGQPLLVLPGGVLPAGLVAAALPLLQASPALIRRPVQHILLALLPAATKGLPSDKLSGDLADTTILELRRVLHSSSSSGTGSAELSVDLDSKADDVLPSRLAAVDALLRACLLGPQARPSPALQVAQLLLQQQARWVEDGYRGAAGGSTSHAHALLLLANSLMSAVADATGSTELLSQQLPLDPLGCAAVQLSSKGLQATGAPFDAAGSSTALTALEQQQPATAQQGQQLKAALLQAPRLVAEYGDQLQLLLEEHPASRRSTGSEGRADKPQLAEKVNVMLTKRMSTLRRDLVHVSELMRDSIVRIQDITPAATIAASTRTSDSSSAPPGAVRLSFDAGTAGAAAAPSSRTAKAAAAAGARPAALAVELVGSGAGAGSTAGTAPAASLVELPSPVATHQELTGVSGIAGLADLGASTQSSRAATPQQLEVGRAVSPDGIKLQGLKQQQGKSKLSATVAEALQQPTPAGAYVVKDVKISRLAGALEPMTF